MLFVKIHKKNLFKMSKPNETLLKRLDYIIEQHLTDASFDIKHLLCYLGMSRTDLHRKIVKKVGMSATEYIRHTRLQHAVVLLTEQPEWGIAQIGYEVGFTSPSYFTRTFIDKYGVCPSAYRKSNTLLEHL
jgi:AraC-like DNA-binding protein